MLDVYCIPGMGADERLFGNLKLDNCIIHHIKWKTINKGEPLQQYAMRLAEQIDIDKPYVLIGVSFGGMCCTEIARQSKPLKTFIISSNKLRSEIPMKIKSAAIFPFYKLFSDEMYIKAAMMMKDQFGIQDQTQLKLFHDMLRASPAGYFKGAVRSIIEWENEERPLNLVHIHGDDDRILPLKKIKDCNYRVKGGKHFMIMNNADEINSIIGKELQKL